MKPLLLIAIAILAVGCGAKDESSTETKPVEEKVVEVKEEINTEEPIAETKPKLEGVNLREFELRGEDILYLKGSDSPYTGKYFTLYENGQKESAGNIKEGKEDGLTVEWHRNGQKKSETNWQNGKIVSEKDWSKNGEEIEAEADK